VGARRWLFWLKGLLGDEKASEAACMAHIRRKFVDVQQSQGSAIAEEAIRHIAALYAIEKEGRGLAATERASHPPMSPLNALDSITRVIYQLCRSITQISDPLTQTGKSS